MENCDDKCFVGTGTGLLDMYPPGIQRTLDKKMKRRFRRVSRIYPGDWRRRLEELRVKVKRPLRNETVEELIARKCLKHGRPVPLLGGERPLPVVLIVANIDNDLFADWK